MRWWIYQKERFPVVAHGLLIAAFSSCAVSFASLLTRSAMPGWQAYGTAFVTCFLFFLQLRIADEFKDGEEDARYRPYRPVPRGLVTLRELGFVFAGSAAVQLAFALVYHPPLALILLLAWSYLGLMSVEFFARDWLKARPVTYLWTHMLIMPLVDLYATACQWMPQGNKPIAGLAAFLAASFANGVVIEIGRKLRQPPEEEEGVDTYSKLWGRPRAAWIWFGMLGVTLMFAMLAANQIGSGLGVGLVLGAVLLTAVPMIRKYVRGEIAGSAFERLSGVWTLVLYLSLGLIPRILS